MVKVSVEKKEDSKVSLSVEAPASVVDAALEKAYKTVVKKVNVPGFRRGKAPRYILERYYGKDVLYEEAMKDVLPEQYMEAVKEAKIEPVDEPSFDDVHFKQGEDLTFKATVYVRPEVTLEDYSDISVPYQAPEVTDEEVSEQIQYIKERTAELQPLPDDAVLEDGDYVICHVKGIEGGDVKSDIDQDLSYVEVGREYGIVPGLADALKGMKKGEFKEFTGTYQVKADTTHEKDSEAGKEAGKEQKTEKEAETASKTAKFKVEVKECYKKRLPTDEEVVKNLNKADMDEVKKDIRAQLLAVKTDAAKREHLAKVEEAILARATVSIPKVMIQRKQEDLVEQFAERLQNSGSSLDKFLKSTGHSIEDLLKDYEEDAQRSVKRELVLDAVSEKENIKASQDTINSVIETLARETGKDVEAVKTTLELRGTMEGLSRDLNRAEVLKQLSLRAAQKAGTPLPAESAPEAKPDHEAAASKPESSSEDASKKETAEKSE